MSSAKGTSIANRSCSVFSNCKFVSRRPRTRPSAAYSRRWYDRIQLPVSRVNAVDSFLSTSPASLGGISPARTRSTAFTQLSKTAGCFSSVPILRKSKPASAESPSWQSMQWSRKKPMAACGGAACPIETTKQLKAATVQINRVGRVFALALEIAMTRVLAKATVRKTARGICRHRWGREEGLSLTIVGRRHGFIEVKC